MLQFKSLIILFSLFLIGGFCSAQGIDSMAIKQKEIIQKKAAKDSLKKFNPRVATFRSAVFPGWGQIYNKKYWKLGLIYPALGITTGIFFYNLNTYKDLRKAFTLKSDSDPLNDTLIPVKYRNLSAESLRTYRNEFRQNIDYTVLVFIIFWGLNVIDATVDAHLKAFDVSDDISMRIKPGYNPQSNKSGLSLVFSLKEKHSKHLSSLP